MLPFFIDLALPSSLPFKSMAVDTKGTAQCFFQCLHSFGMVPVTVRQPDLIEHPAMLSAGVLPVGAIEWIDDHCLVCLLAYDEVIEVVPLAQLCLQHYDSFI